MQQKNVTLINTHKVMKHFNRLLVAFVFGLISLVTYGQNDCGSAVGLGVLTTTPSTFGPTTLEPAAAPNDLADSLWFSYTPAVTGYLTISSCDILDNNNSRLVVFKGATCGTLAQVATSDDDCGVAALLNDLPVVGGTQYFLLWDNPSANAFDLIFRASFVDVPTYLNPANDDACDSTKLILDAAAVAGNNEHASLESTAEALLRNQLKNFWDTDSRIRNSVWYSFVAPSTGMVSLSVTGTTFRTQVALLTANCADLSSATVVNADDAASGVDVVLDQYCLTPGATYYVLVDGFGTESGDFDIQVQTIDLTAFSFRGFANDATLFGAPKCPGEVSYGFVVGLANDTLDETNYTNPATYMAGVNPFGSTNYLAGGSFSISGDTADYIVGPAFPGVYAAFVKAGTTTVTYTDICGSVFDTTFTFVDTTIAPLTLTIDSVLKPTCHNTANGTVFFTTSGGYKYIDGSNAATDSLLYTYKYNADSSFSDAALYAAYQAGPISQFTTPTQYSALSPGKYLMYVEDACGNYDSAFFAVTRYTYGPVQIASLNTVDPFCPGDASGKITIAGSGGYGRPGGSLRVTARYNETANTFNLGTTADSLVVPGFTNSFTIAEFNALGLDSGYYRIRLFDICNSANNKVDTVQLLGGSVDEIVVTSSPSVSPTAAAATDGSITINATGGKINRVTYYLDPSFNGVGQVIIPSGTVLTALEDNFAPTGLGQGVYAAFVNDSCSVAGDTTLVFKLFAPVANDEPCNAIAVDLASAPISFTNTGATATEAGTIVIPQNNDDGYNGWFETAIQKSVWFTFVAPASGSVNITTNHLNYSGNFNFDPQVAVLESADCNSFAAFNLLAANDNNGTNNDSYLEVNCLTPGVTYYVLVDGYIGAGSVEGAFQIDINANTIAPLAATVTSLQPNCNTPTGTITITGVAGGIYTTTPEEYIYRYTIAGPSANSTMKFEPSDLPIAFAGLANGTYTVTIADTCGTEVVKTIVISSGAYDAITADITVVDPRCPGGSEFGAVTFAISGGGTPGTYTWDFVDVTGGSVILESGTDVSTIIGDTASTAYTSALDAGIYKLIITDNCAPVNMKEYTIELTDPVLSPITATLDITSATCTDGTDAKILVDVAGGSGFFRLSNYAQVAPYPGDYFDNANRERGALSGAGGPGTFQDTVTLSNVWFPGYTGSAGDYVMLVRDYCEVIAVGSGGFNNHTPVVATLIDTVEYTIGNPAFAGMDIVATVTNSDIGADNGVISFTVTGGALPYASVLVAPVVNIDAGYSIDSLAPGTYTITVTDACGTSYAEAFTIVDRPANDDVCAATALTLGVAKVGSNVGASVQSSVASPVNNGNCDAVNAWCGGSVAEATVWYKVAVPASGSFKVTVVNDVATFNPKIAAYLSNDCANLGSPIAANEDISIVAPIDTNASLTLGCLTPGDTVYIMVSGNDDLTGAFTITATAANTTALNINANVTNATTVTSADGQIQINVTGGVKPYTYAWTDNGTSSVTIEDRTGLSPGTYSVTATDACGTTKTKTFIIDYVTVDNDDVCNAFDLPIDGINRIYSNEGASVQAGEPAPATNGDCFSTTQSKWCSGDGLDGSVWFKFTAPASGTVNVSLCNDALNTFDTQLAVYKASLCGNFGSFVLVGANDDLSTCSLGSGVDLTGLTPCATYYVQVDSDGGAEGEFGIKLSDPSTTLNAGPDVTIASCVNYADITLASVLNGAADTDGYFVDADNNIVTTFVNNDVAGTFTFTYIVADSCVNKQIAKDQATYTINVGECVGINETAETTFGVYPNPNKGSFTVSSSALKLNGTLVVTDLSGREVHKLELANVKSNSVDVVLNNAAAGVYMVRLLTDNESFVQRIVVE